MHPEGGSAAADRRETIVEFPVETDLEVSRVAGLCRVPALPRIPTSSCAVAADTARRLIGGGSNAAGGGICGRGRTQDAHP